MEKTTLCLTCAKGLVRETDQKNITVKCFAGDDYPGQPITSCNEFIRNRIKKTTYHDSDFAEYEKKMLSDESSSHCRIVY